MATKTLLSENLYSTESETDFLLTVDGEPLGMVKGKSQAEKAVIVIVEKRELELKDPYTRVSREKISNGFAILTQSLGYVMNGSPIQKHVIKFIPLPTLSFEEIVQVDETPKVKESEKVEIPTPPPNPLVSTVKSANVMLSLGQEIQESKDKLVPYNSAEYSTYPSAY